MKRPIFDKNIEVFFSTLSDEQRARYKSNELHYLKVIKILGAIFACAAGALSVPISMYVSFDYMGISMFGVFFVFGISWAAIYGAIYTARYADDDLIKCRIARLLPAKKNYYSADVIKSVEVVYGRETLLQSRFNRGHNIYQYNVFVRFLDGTYKEVNVLDNTLAYQALVRFAGKTAFQAKRPMSLGCKMRIAEYKRLLDYGHMTRAEFQEKEKEMIDLYN